MVPGPRLVELVLSGKLSGIELALVVWVLLRADHRTHLVEPRSLEEIRAELSWPWKREHLGRRLQRIKSLGLIHYEKPVPGKTDQRYRIEVTGALVHDLPEGPASPLLRWEVPFSAKQENRSAEQGEPANPLQQTDSDAEQRNPAEERAALEVDVEKIKVLGPALLSVDDAAAAPALEGRSAAQLAEALAREQPDRERHRKRAGWALDFDAKRGGEVNPPEPVKRLPAKAATTRSGRRARVLDADGQVLRGFVFTGPNEPESTPADRPGKED
jgi:hypothetical protein